MFEISRSAFVLLSFICLANGRRTSRAEDADATSERRWADLRGVWQADFNHGASHVVASLRSGEIGILDVTKGTLVQGDLGFGAPSTDHVVSTDGKMVLVGTKEGCRVFDTTSANAISPPLDARLRANLPTPAVFSPDGKVVLIFEEKQASVWNVRNGERVAAMSLPPGPHDDAPPSALFAAAGAHCFVMDPDGTVTRCDAKTWKPAGKPMRHPRLEMAYEFGFAASEDGRFIATFDDAGENGPKGQLQVWDAIANKSLGPPLVTINGFSARFIPGADRIVVQPARGDASVRELPSMKTAYAIRAHDELDGPRIGVSPDGKWILSWGPDRTLDVIDAKTGKMAGNTSSSAAVKKILFGPNASECYAVFDNTAFFLQDYHDNYIMKMSLPELTITGSLRTLGYLARVSLSPNGQRLLVVDGKTDQERILVFETDGMKPIALE